MELTDGKMDTSTDRPRHMDTQTHTDTWLEMDVLLFAQYMPYSPGGMYTHTYINTRMHVHPHRCIKLMHDTSW